MKGRDGARREAAGGRLAFHSALLLVGLLTALRLWALFHSPVELYPEEAQYWLWSRRLALGYFSKPPMIAWMIRAATRMGGDTEAVVRLPAPLCHAVAALALQRAGARLYDGWTGFWAAALYSLMPGVALSAAVVATDAPLLGFCALALWAYAAWLASARSSARLGWAAALGAALGLACLSKYAALYLAAGMALHAAVDPQARRRWRVGELGLAIGAGLLIVAPNLVWNAAHGFETLRHTAADAAWSAGTDAVGPARARLSPDLGLRSASGFVAGQFAVFGPAPMGAFLLGAGLAIFKRKRRAGSDVALLALAAPALLLILGEAVASRANANWAAVAYLPAAILTAAWLLRWRAWRTLSLAIVSETLVLAASVAAGCSPGAADRMRLSNSFKRARGWEATAALVDAQVARAGPITAIAVDDRFTFNALAYYDRRALIAEHTPLRMWVREARPHNAAESDRPLRPPPALDGGRVLFVDVGGAYRREAMNDFARVQPVGAWRVRVDRDARHDRRVFMFVGLGFNPRPRDPKTGLPPP